MGAYLSRSLEASSTAIPGPDAAAFKYSGREGETFILYNYSTVPNSFLFTVSYVLVLQEITSQTTLLWVENGSNRISQKLTCSEITQT